ncbi:uncharacterized protein LOC105666395 isoform X2 [Bombus terrestris]|uniref:Uncharacterized protein LOC105666395 isoform X2 n=1 Tax=Bombus terrestris TaxID=30195 RepID=A0A9C6W3Y8_BOMTE|nr:uncharacterized protein LOC105666395 isoform X2 [Bombus terrestris]
MSRKIITDTMDKQALIVSFFLFFASAISASDRRTTELSCSGRAYYNVTLAAYYPVFDSDNEFDYLDARTRKLRNLQDYLDDRAEFVTVSMDLDSGIPYGTKLCIPELNEKFLRPIPLQARDKSRYDDVGKNSPDFSHVDICVRTEQDTYDNSVNGIVTLYAELLEK